MIRLRVLGPIELRDAQGRELVSILAQPKRLALLACLAVSPGFHRRDTLLALFWPELDPAHARPALNQAIRFLRRQLGDVTGTVVVSRGPEALGIDRSLLWCDAAAFQDELATRQYQDALDLYRGHLLEGFHSTEGRSFGDWLEQLRGSMRAQAAHAARELARLYGHEQRYTMAVANARRAAELLPDDERVVRELLELLDRGGDRAGAIHAYEAFAARLRQELDVEPAAATAELIAAIRARPAAAIGRATPAPPEIPGNAPVEARTPAEFPLVPRPIAPSVIPRVSEPGQRPDPQRRLLYALIVLALTPLVSFVAGGTGGMEVSRAAVPALRVIVADFRVSGLDTTLGPVLSEMTRTALAQSHVLGVITPVEVRATLSRMGQPPARAIDVAVAREIAAREGLQGVVAGTVAPLGSGMLVVMRLMHPDSGHATREFRAQVRDADEILRAIDRLARQVRSSAGESMGSIRSTPFLERVTTPSLEAFQRYSEGVVVSMDLDFVRAAELYRQAIALDSGFAMAWRRLAAMMGNLRQLDARDSAIQRAYRHRHRATEYERLQIEGYYFSTAGASRSRAARAYETSGRLYGDRGNLAAVWLSRREFARVESALTLTTKSGRAATRALPYVNLIEPLLNQGKFAEAARAIEVLEQRFPHSRDLARLQRARFAYLNGDIAGYERQLDSLRRATDVVQIDVARMRTSLSLMRGQIGVFQADLAPSHADRTPGRGASTVVHALILRAVITIVVRRDHRLGLAHLDTAEAALRNASAREVLDALAAMARLGALAGDHRRARRLLERYTVLAGTGAHEWAEPVRKSILGYIALAEGKGLLARRHFSAADTAIDGPVHDCTMCAFRELAAAHEAAGQRDSAILMYEKYLSTPYFQRMLVPLALAGSVLLNVDPVALPGVYEALGRLHEARGDSARAADYYGRFVRLWQDADSTLQPRVDRARARLILLRHGS